MELITLQVRDVKENESRIVALLKCCIEDSFSKVPGESFFEEKLESMADHINDGTAHVFVAKEDNEIVGLLWGYRHSTELEEAFHVAYIAVLPEKRGCGIGRELLRRAEETAKQLGIVNVELIVSEDNLNALSFYKKLGFKTERRTMSKTIDRCGE